MSRYRANSRPRWTLLDIVASRDDLPPPSVEVVDVSLSDHPLVRWSVLMCRSLPDYTTAVVRPWRQLDPDAFRDGLMSSMLCQPDTWKNYDVDSLARLYDTQTSAVLDRLFLSGL